MHRLHQTTIRAALMLILLGGGTIDAASRPVCKPVVSSRAERLSHLFNQQRRWTGIFAVDASPCATISGTFDVDFVREKEVGPDLPFRQRFIWKPGDNEIAMDFWWDERVVSYRVGDVAACPCRE